jgi:FkbM family methyltransferase
MNIKRFGDLRISYRPDTSDEHVLFDCLENDIYFIPEWFPREGDTIIDIGAHIGAFSLRVASRFKGAKVHAVEPCADSFMYLTQNVALNGLANISTYRVALTDCNGTTQLYYDIDSGNWGHSIVKAFSGQCEEVPADTLSNFMEENGIVRCDYMKINCEGAEFKILLNTPKEVLRRICVMLIMYHLHLAEEYTEKDLVEYLDTCGFRVKVRNRGFGGGWIIATNRESYSVQPLHLGFRRMVYFLRDGPYWIRCYGKQLKSFVRGLLVK